MPRVATMIKLGLGVLSAVLILGVWLMLSAREARKLKPPPSVTTIQDFLQQMPSPMYVRRFAFGEATYFEVWGQLGGTIRLPSGPPSYIFDPNGRLVDWTSDRGDAGNYSRKWGHFKDAQFISVPEMLQALARTNAAAPVRVN